MIEGRGITLRTLLESEMNDKLSLINDVAEKDVMIAIDVKKTKDNFHMVKKLR